MGSEQQVHTCCVRGGGGLCQFVIDEGQTHGTVLHVGFYILFGLQVKYKLIKYSMGENEVNKMELIKTRQGGGGDSYTVAGKCTFINNSNPCTVADKCTFINNSNPF